MTKEEKAMTNEKQRERIGEKIAELGRVRKIQQMLNCIEPNDEDSKAAWSIVLRLSVWMVALTNVMSELESPEKNLATLTSHEIALQLEAIGEHNFDDIVDVWKAIQNTEMTIPDSVLAFTNLSVGSDVN